MGSFLDDNTLSSTGTEDLISASTKAQQKIDILEAENALLKQQIKHLESEQGIDFLTGAKNRKAFEHELEHSLQLIRKGADEHRAGAVPLKEVSLIFVDLDHFKKINDTYGHLMGDEVLQKVATLLMHSIRSTDVVARVGGEEFIVLLRDANESIAERDAEKFRVQIAQMRFEKYPDLTLTASFGVISSKNLQHSVKSMYEGADQALYTAKRAGRNQVMVSQTA
jgi:diguanylate cyclase (GGDEF)-like protein